MIKPFKEAIRLETPGAELLIAVHTGRGNTFRDLATDRLYINVNDERNTIDHHRVFREIELVPVLEPPEHPLRDELIGTVEMHSPILDRWLASERCKRTLES
ncbi:hypothetical protein LCGC14_0609900 [marine sediment metagenome]|uniref:Uncharacterized protein n=1 Tax=marine sediment metagenome TaxID=412755 RepID=A0A0F9RCQ6_9ZZZZ